MSRFSRLVVAGCLAWLYASCGWAQEGFPAKTVRIVVPWPPGGPPDMVARLAAPRLSELWGSPVIVENRAGATGTIGTEAVLKSAPDGYTLLLTSNQPIVIAPALFATPYDPTRDLASVAIFGEAPNVLVVSLSSGVRSVAELIAAAKAKPGALTFSSAGPGAIGHLSGELAKQIASIDMLHVPYPGTAQAVTAVVTGEVSLTCSSMQQTVPQIKAGKVKALGVTGLRPSQFMPELAPLSDQGFKDLDVTAWYGLFAPLKTPRPVVRNVRDTLQKVLQNAEVRQKLNGAGIELIWLTAEEETARKIQADLSRYRKVVQFARIKASE